MWSNSISVYYSDNGLMCVKNILTSYIISGVQHGIGMACSNDGNKFFAIRIIGYFASAQQSRLTAFENGTQVN